jgi:alpha-L-fucosidase 2
MEKYMKKQTFILILIIFCNYSFSQPGESKKSSHSIKFDSIPHVWDEAMPLGNGMLGVLIWQKDNKLRMALDRGDLWDLRPVEEFKNRNFKFKFIYENYKKNNYEPIGKMIDIPYEKNIAPAKIPGSALEFDISKFGSVKNIYTSLDSAFSCIEWKNGVIFKSFIHAELPVGWFKFENIEDDFIPDLVTPYIKKKTNISDSIVSSLNTQDASKLNYSIPVIIRTKNSISYHQAGFNGFSFDINLAWKRIDNKTITGVWTITTKGGPYSNKENAGEITVRALYRGYENDFLSHLNWWKKYWEKSAISIPDKKLENQWYSEIYKFGSASRRGAPPISLQAIWTADNGKLPPWRGDYHNDLNTQLSYWHAYSSNHLDEELSYLDWLWKIKDNCKKFTKSYFEKNGLNVPGVCTLTGDPLGGWGQYSLSITTSAWLSHNFYMHYKFSNDQVFLKQRAYPYIRDVAIFLDQISTKEKNGKRKIPLSSSPEINDNTLQAWFPEITNYDLSLIRWLYSAASELAADAGKKNEAKKWNTILNEWQAPAISPEKGLLVASEYPLPASHRHFSHLMSIYPLGLINLETPDGKNIIDASLKELERLGTDWWCGYSFSWLGNLYARAMEGDKASGILKTFAECFCSKNTFHLNGDQSKSGKSKWTYRPFTLEGNFAFASGIQEMLLQSYSGIIKIFPAIPKDWKDLSFKTLRAEGAFLVSAEMRNGEVKEVRIISETGGDMNLLHPFGDKKIKINNIGYEKSDKIIKLKMKKGEEVILNN